MAGSVSISKPNRSEASLQPQLLKKRVSEFRLNITREVRMSQLRLETPSLDDGFDMDPLPLRCAGVCGPLLSASLLPISIAAFRGTLVVTRQPHRDHDSPTIARAVHPPLAPSTSHLTCILVAIPADIL